MCTSSLKVGFDYPCDIFKFDIGECYDLRSDTVIGLFSLHCVTIIDRV